MKLLLSINIKRFLIIIGAYTLTLSNAEVKEQFYAELNTLLCTSPASGKLLVLGDFNDRVGKDSAQ